MKIIVSGSSHGDPMPGRFQTSLLLESSGKYYLIDAAEPCSGQLINHGIHPAQLSGIFVTHMHIDHTSGLPVVIYQAVKRRNLFPDVKLQIFLPSPDAKNGLESWMKVNGLSLPEEIKFSVITPETHYCDETLKVSFFPTRHLPPGNDRLPRSYAILVECEGKKVLFSGDIAADFQDFPAEIAAQCDLVFCELTHYKLDTALEKFQKLPAKSKLYFYHLHTPWQTPEGEAKIMAECSALASPVKLVRDGEIIEE